MLLVLRRGSALNRLVILTYLRVFFNESSPRHTVKSLPQYAAQSRSSAGGVIFIQRWYSALVQQSGRAVSARW